jgi:pyrroloquinoline quinone biosynthesis protein B
MNVEAILLGTAQDGGVPQAGCTCTRCRAAHADPSRRQWVACLGLVDRQARQGWLIDATPDFREQVHALHAMAPDCPLAGVLLTHAHIGHYAGLIHLGREAWNTDRLPLYASPRMARFLGEHAPWSQLVALGNVEVRTLAADQTVQLSPRLSLVPLPVPHRDEYSDTLAFVVEGPAKRLLYCPDIDAWERWKHDVRQFVGQMDVALLDGTFFNAKELPGRDLSQIPHPLVTDTAGRLAGVDCDVRFIHLNHSNPLHEPGPERDWLAAQGLGVGTFGARWRLD